MTGSVTTEDIAAAYFAAWTSNDVERVRPLLHPDVDFVGSLGATHGIKDTLAGLGGMFAMTKQWSFVLLRLGHAA